MKQDGRGNQVNGSNDKKQSLTRADRKQNHSATHHRILNVLIVLAAIVTSLSFGIRKSNLSPLNLL
jgi:hypothetical protein